MRLTDTNDILLPLAVFFSTFAVLLMQNVSEFDQFCGIRIVQTELFLNFHSKVQLAELIDSLDKEYWEADLYAALEEIRDEVHAHMEISEDLTNKARGSNKCFLTAANGKDSFFFFLHEYSCSLKVPLVDWIRVFIPSFSLALSSAFTPLPAFPPVLMNATQSSTAGSQESAQLFSNLTLDPLWSTPELPLRPSLLIFLFVAYLSNRVLCLARCVCGRII